MTDALAYASQDLLRLGVWAIGHDGNTVLQLDPACVCGGRSYPTDRQVPAIELVDRQGRIAEQVLPSGKVRVHEGVPSEVDA